MNLNLRTPDVAALSCLTSCFSQTCDFPIELAHRTVTSMQPGERVPMLRSAKGRTSVELITWDAIQPTHLANRRSSSAYRCLIPAFGFSAEFDDKRCDLESIDGEFVMIAGCWQPLNATEVALTRLLFADGGPMEDGPIAIPKGSWADWLDPTKDIRDLQRSSVSSWRRRELA